MELTLLAVTRMDDDRICMAGVDNRGIWHRPVKQHPYHFVESDITSEEGKKIFQPFNIVEWDVQRNINDGPHTEDFLFSKQPKLVRSIKPKLKDSFLSRMAENEFFKGQHGKRLNIVLKEKKRSLILVGPVEIKKITLKKKDTPRVAFDIPRIYEGVRDLPCTDRIFKDNAMWVCKQSDRDSAELTGDEIKKVYKYDKVYLALGLSREYKCDYWEMVVGFHTIPDYQEDFKL